MSEIKGVSSGIEPLDKLLNGLYIGDNVVWHDDSGSLAGVFCLNFIRESGKQGKPVIYVTFDRSPKNLLDKLGPLADNPGLTILDCFTHGKGESAPVFLKFYEESAREQSRRMICVKQPREPGNVMDALYEAHAARKKDVRFVFESLTGMQELWGGDERIVTFYAHSCPRLYELNTIAYWIMEKRAHSPRVRARINQIAQVAINLSVRRGATTLTILKAEKRDLTSQNQPYNYWTRELDVSFDFDRKTAGRLNIGARLKDLRARRGLSQTALAKMVGVTPSSISQVESDQVHPSLTALMKMAEVLSVNIASFFEDGPGAKRRVVFPESEAATIRDRRLPEGSVAIKALTPLDHKAGAAPHIIEIPAGRTLPFHFFIHKGDEAGYVLSGNLEFTLVKTVYTARTGDVIYLTTDAPGQWRNTGTDVARLLWINMK